MSHSSRIGVFGVGIVCGALVLVACGAPPDPGQSKSQDETAAAGNKGSGSSSTPSKTPASNPSNPTTPTSPTTPPADTDAGGPTGSPDQACSAMTAADACTTCCEAAHPAGTTVYQDASDACMCGAAGKCQTECAKTDCSADDNAPDSVTGDACDLCENANDPDTGVGGCTAPIQAACAGNADCVALQTCYDACP